MIEARNIQIAYKNTGLLLDIEHLLIEDKESVAIYGASGSGKSSLLSVLGCLQKPSSGNIIVNAKNTENLSHTLLAEMRRNTFGYVLIGGYFLEELSVEENIKLTSLSLGSNDTLNISEADKHLHTMLDYFEVKHLLSSRISNCSTGERERIHLIRALYRSPDILILDEPCANLDTRMKKKYRDFIEKLMQKHTIIIATHDDIWRKKVDSVYEIDNKKIHKIFV